MLNKMKCENNTLESGNDSRGEPTHPGLCCPAERLKALQSLHGEDYVRTFTASPGQRVRLKHVLKNVDIGGDPRILDVGCGPGFVLSHWKGIYASYLGVDISKEFISVAQELYADREGVDFRCGMLQQFTEEFAGQFDLCLLLDLSEHLADDLWLDLLESARRCLVPGGKILVHTPNRDFVIEVLKARNLILRQFPEHVAVRTLERNTELLCKAGFIIWRAGYIPHYRRPLNWLHGLHFGIPFLRRRLGARILIEATTPMTSKRNI